jgi:hypothetical protein
LRGHIIYRGGLLMLLDAPSYRKVACWASLWVVAGCGPRDLSLGGNGFDQNPPAQTGGSAVQSAGGRGGGPSDTTDAANAISNVRPPTDDEVCARDSVKAEAHPIDLFIMQDRSLSMNYLTDTGETKWQVITAALKAFLSDPASAGLSAGIGFFPQFIDPASVEGTPDLVCNLDSYATPVVGMGLLPDNTAAITQAFNERAPQGETPTRVAELGAVAYARQWSTLHPTHRVIVVLATDGDPNVCSGSISGVANAATQGVVHGVTTYVIGIVAADQKESIPNLNRMAAGGGTGSAFIVNAVTDTKNQFTQAMNAIRNGSRLGCQFDFPRPTTGDFVDPTRASVLYTASGSSAPLALPWMASSASCGTLDGFYYDNNSNPRSIRLCNATCAQVQDDAGAEIGVVTACSPPGMGAGGSNAGGSVEQGGSELDAGTEEDASIELGGSAEGGNGTEPSAPPCLFNGQACTDPTECCDGVCNELGTCGIRPH